MAQELTESDLAPIKVKAKGDPRETVGYYDILRRRGGDVFVLKPVTIKEKNGKEKVLTPKQQFSERWMTKVPDDIPETKPGHFNKVGKGQPRPEPSETDKEVL